MAKPCLSIRDLAKAVDKSHVAVGRWLKHPEWPFGRKPPWRPAEIPKILRWAAATLQSQHEGGSTTADADDASGDEMKALRKRKLTNEIRKLLANAEQAETALARERGKLLDAEEVEREWAGIGVLLRNAFQNLGSQVLPLALTQGLPHEAAPTFQLQVEEIVTGILRRLSGSDAAEDDIDG